MRTLIIYYSRTGTTRKLATALAGALNAEVREIGCEKYRSGFLRYLRAGYDSVKGNLPPIEAPLIDAAEYDLLLVGAPVWTSYPALPLRAYLADKPAVPANVGVFLTYGGHSPSAKAFGGVAEALQQQPVATLALKAEDVAAGSLEAAIGPFVRQLRSRIEVASE